MIQTINEHDFRQAFRDCDRGNQFTPEALGYIFDYLEQYEGDTDTPYELDVIALCCDISEMSLDEVRDTYCLDADADVMDYLGDHTSIIGELPDGDVVFFQF